MTSEQKFKESYYFNDFDTKIEGNLYNNISIPINTEEKQNEDNNIHGELFPFIFEEDNNGGLFSIKKNLLLSDKKIKIHQTLLKIIIIMIKMILFLQEKRI